MNDEELRARLAASNPVPPTEPVDPVTSDRARELMEDIMTTKTRDIGTDRRRMRMIGAVAAVLTVVVGAAAIFTGGPSAAPDDEALVLTAEGGDALASCLPFSVDILADMPIAFGGTVVAVTDSVATIEVDRWFAGGDEAIVELEYTPGYEALIGTPSMEVGQRYLLTATDGVLNGCGYSGPATADYETSFEQAFGA